MRQADTRLLGLLSFFRLLFTEHDRRPQLIFQLENLLVQPLDFSKRQCALQVAWQGSSPTRDKTIPVLTRQVHRVSGSWATVPRSFSFSRGRLNLLVARSRHRNIRHILTSDFTPLEIHTLALLLLPVVVRWGVLGQRSPSKQHAAIVDTCDVVCGASTNVPRDGGVILAAI